VISADPPFLVAAIPPFDTVLEVVRSGVFFRKKRPFCKIVHSGTVISLNTMTTRQFIMAHIVDLPLSNQQWPRAAQASVLRASATFASLCLNKRVALEDRVPNLQRNFFKKNAFPLKNRLIGGGYI